MEQVMHHGKTGQLAPSLYVVATPIGNLADVTLRALEILKTVDVIAAEDTRVTAKLLAQYGITARLISLHEHNERRASARILDLMGQGKSVALVSDAGTPTLSDPGSLAVTAARERGFRVIPIPGPNAAICAASASGTQLPLLFYGFLPARSAERRKALDVLGFNPYPMVFYEAPHRVLATVSDLADAFGPQRRITIARELTKLFETIHSCGLAEAAPWLNADGNRLKGEFVLVVDGAPQTETPEPDAARTLEILLTELPLKQAVRIAAALTGARKNDVYALALKLKGGTEIL